MTPRASRSLVALAAVVAVLVALAYLLAPPAARPVAAGDEPAVVRGVLHVHTGRSDGSGSLDEIAAAAALADLDFVILTDHGDGTRPPDPPGYRGGVLLIDALEISTDGGHVVALDVPGATYPLGGEARDVVEDVRRLGGLALAAHPGSPREALRWSDWDLPIDGLEWLNADSSWRDESWLSLAAALLSYPVRPAEALANLLDRPVDVVERWDALTPSRRLVAIAAVDAHARIGLRGREPRPAFGVALPSYESTFGLVTIGLPGVTLGFGAETDARAVLDAVRTGHVYSTVDALAGPGVLRFAATSGPNTARAGDLMSIEGPVSLNVVIQGPSGARIDLLRGGEVIASGEGAELRYEAEAVRGAYRVEVNVPWAPGTPPVPWMLSNPIYVGGVPEGPADVAPAMVAAVAGAPPGEWAIENSAGSEGAIAAVTGPSGDPEALLRFALSGRLSDAPYVAFVVPVGEVFGERDRVAFSVRADRPVRVDVQVRTPTPQPGEGGEAVLGERWHRSVYAEEDLRSVTIPLAEFTPKGPTNEASAASDAIDSLLFVVDTVNTAVGTGGRILVSNLRFGRAE